MGENKLSFLDVVILNMFRPLPWAIFRSQKYLFEETVK